MSEDMEKRESAKNESSKQETVSDIFEEMLHANFQPFYYQQRINEYVARLKAAINRKEQCYLDQIRDAVNMIGHERYVAEHSHHGESANLKKEMDIAAGYINNYLDEIPLNKEVHDWLIRNGYQDESYQNSCFEEEEQSE